MKSDIVIIGGGLASILAGIKLLKAGKSVIIVSAGQSALHFSSGSMGLYSHHDGEDVVHPLDHLDSLAENHPYTKIGGREKVKNLLLEGCKILEEAGISLKGSIERNHYRLTPFGMLQPAWLTLSDHLTVESPNDIKWKKAALIGIKGFLDFFPEYLRNGLEKLGVQCTMADVNIREFEILRKNPTEMRAPNIARVLNDEALTNYAAEINRHIGDADVAIIPAVLGLNDEGPVKKVRDMVKCELYSVSTTPTAVPGIRMQIMLRHLFKKLGGWYLLGDTATDGIFSEKNNLKSLNTANLGANALTAEHYILATGSFFSKGLRATYSEIIEPIFGLDVDFPKSRQEWFDENLFKAQPFMKFGVKTDKDFLCHRGGKKINNLHAIGGVLEGCDPMREGAGAGVAISSALFVADQILKN